MAPLLPIFPLDTVLLPGAPLPLHIFEPRYRALVADVWGGHDGVPEQSGFGIVAVGHRGDGEVRGPGRHQRSADGAASAASATGASSSDSVDAAASRDAQPDVDPTGGLALVGTFASIREVEPYADGRADVLTIGARRFRLVELEPNGKPYLQAQVDWLAEESGEPSDGLVEAARSGCIRYLSELAQLAGRELPEVRFASDPITLSYQVASRMRLANSERQGLLEAATAAERLRMAARLLRREIVLLSRTRSVAVSPGLLHVESRPN